MFILQTTDRCWHTYQRQLSHLIQWKIFNGFCAVRPLLLLFVKRNLLLSVAEPSQASWPHASSLCAALPWRATETPSPEKKGWKREAVGRRSPTLHTGQLLLAHSFCTMTGQKLWRGSEVSKLWVSCSGAQQVLHQKVSFSWSISSAHQLQSLLVLKTISYLHSFLCYLQVLRTGIPAHLTQKKPDLLLLTGLSSQVGGLCSRPLSHIHNSHTN